MERAGQGDGVAREQLLGAHRTRLRQMIAVRLDRRLVTRIDPFDVVQDVLAVATRNLSDYLRTRPMPEQPKKGLATVSRPDCHARARPTNLARPQPVA
jgi:RNA polymerase sigma-70 factor (ECF subfamily)